MVEDEHRDLPPLHSGNKGTVQAWLPRDAGETPMQNPPLSEKDPVHSGGLPGPSNNNLV